MLLIQIHDILANTFLYFSAIIALWALFHMIRGKEIGGDFFGAVVIGEVVVVLQSVVGIIMMIMGLVPARGIHYLYGAVTVLMWPAVFAITRGETSEREALYWTLSSGFLFGIILRAIQTATHVLQ